MIPYTLLYIQIADLTKAKYRLPYAMASVKFLYTSRSDLVLPYTP